MYELAFDCAIRVSSSSVLPVWKRCRATQRRRQQQTQPLTSAVHTECLRTSPDTSATRNGARRAGGRGVTCAASRHASIRRAHEYAVPGEQLAIVELVVREIERRMAADGPRAARDAIPREPRIELAQLVGERAAMALGGSAVVVHHRELRHGERPPRLGEVRVVGELELVAIDGLRHQAARLQELAQPIVRLRQVGPASERAPIRGDRFVAAPELLEGGSAVELRRREPGRERQRLVVMDERLVAAAAVLQHAPQVDVGVRDIGAKRDGGLELADGRVGLSERLVRDGEVVASPDGCSVDRDGSLDSRPSPAADRRARDTRARGCFALAPIADRGRRHARSALWHRRTAVAGRRSRRAGGPRRSTSGRPRKPACRCSPPRRDGPPGGVRARSRSRAGGRQPRPALLRTSHGTPVAGGDRGSSLHRLEFTCRHAAVAEAKKRPTLAGGAGACINQEEVLIQKETSLPMLGPPAAFSTALRPGTVTRRWGETPARIPGGGLHALLDLEGLTSCP